jgi:hypothetical protein
MTWLEHPDRHCAGMDTNLFVGTIEQQRSVVTVCNGCPVRTECATQGKKEPYGVWGGTIEGTPGRPLLAGRPVRPLGRAPSEEQAAELMLLGRQIIEQTADEFEMDIYLIITSDPFWASRVEVRQVRSEAIRRVVAGTGLPYGLVGEMFGGRSRDVVWRALVKERPQLKPCGTEAAHRRHIRRGEEPCRDCLKAKAAYTRDVA